MKILTCDSLNEAAKMVSGYLLTFKQPIVHVKNWHIGSLKIADLFVLKLVEFYLFI